MLMARCHDQVFLVLFIFVLPISGKAMASTDRKLTSTTIELPQGSRYIPDQRLLCTPSTWSSILLFFLANYVARVGTFRSASRDLGMTQALNMLTALLLPSTGLALGLQRIRAHAIFSKTPLEKACRAGALCAVIRTPQWLPHGSDQPVQQQDSGLQIDMRPLLENYQALVATMRCFLPPKSWYNDKALEVHGKCVLPSGYALALLPRTFPMLEYLKQSLKNSGNPSLIRELDGISMSYSFSKGIVAIFQIVYTSTTLYQAQGDQTTRFRYAAFGLTVTPYILMSLINLVSSLLTPEFPTVYPARDSVMSEVEARTGTKFDRVVADLTVQPDPDMELASLDSLHLRRNLAENADPEISLGDLASNGRPVSCSATIPIAHVSNHSGHRSNKLAGLAYLLPFSRYLRSHRQFIAFPSSGEHLGATRLDPDMACGRQLPNVLGLLLIN